MNLKKICFTIAMFLSTSEAMLIADSTNYQFSQKDSCLDDCCFAPPCCPSKNRFFARGDVLYWTPRITGLELDFGSSDISENIVDCTQILTTKEIDQDPHFKWDTGYRVGLGYEACQWTTEALWTHFQGNGSRNDHHRLNEGKTSIKLDQIDLALAYNYDATCALTFKPFVGVRAARIREHVKALLNTNLSLVANPEALETRKFDDKQKYWGVGPLLGLEGNWEIGCGFGIYGVIAGSLLYGDYEIKLNDSDVFSAPISKQVFSANKRHLHAFDYNLDLGVGINWHKMIGRFDINMKLGFEQHQYFNQNRMCVGRGDVSFTGVIFALELGF